MKDIFWQQHRRSFATFGRSIGQQATTWAEAVPIDRGFQPIDRHTAPIDRQTARKPPHKRFLRIFDCNFYFFSLKRVRLYKRSFSY